MSTPKRRKSIPKSIRFEVFKRDSFKCQYCGVSAPDVLLQIDHIHPVAKGGDGDITNLITACESCNAGKSDRVLSDQTAAQKRKVQLDQLQERREQLEMMAEWQRGLIDLDEHAVTQCSGLWSQIANGYHITEHGIPDLRRMVKKFGMQLVMESMRAAALYLITDGSGKFTSESVNLAFGKIGAICTVKKRERETPGIGELYRIRGIMRSRCSYFRDWEAMDWLKAALSWGYTPEEILERLKPVHTWTAFSDAIDEMISEARERQGGR